MITDGLGYKNRMVEEEFSISTIIVVLLGSVRKLFNCDRKKTSFESSEKELVFKSKDKRIVI